jgi:hypothetical protein
MGRPRKPTSILELTGAFEKNPNRAILRVNEPIPSNDVGDPPPYFNEYLTSIWNEIIENAAPGVIKRSDRLVIEAWCQIIAYIRCGIAQAPTFAQHKAYAQQFGMTPAARSLVQVPQDDNGNEFAKAAAEIAAARAKRAPSG